MLLQRLAHFTLVLCAGLALACDKQDGATGGSGGTCPPCECVCDCDGADTATGTNSDSGGSVATPGPGPAMPSGEVSELVASANRHMMHGDGEACLADLDRVQALDTTIASHLLITRAQCRMLVGECQEAKQTIVDWYMREQAFTKELAEKTAESIGSMRCRGGDSTERDRLLAALFDLQDGAYMNKRDVAFCRDRVSIVEQLGPRVKPKSAEDTQVTGGLQALFHTSAMCFARAGDCSTAYAYYRKLFPPDALKALSDPQLREKTVRESFDSTIVLCQPNP